MKNASYELNFFLRFRDPEFFDKVAVPCISSKLEKRFFDWYLLSGKMPAYREKVISCLD